MPSTGMSLKLKSLDPSNCDPDKKKKKKNKKNAAATAVLLHNMNLVNACDQSIGSENWCAITSWVEFS